MNRVHVHFGIGALGIGAVLPVLNDDMQVIFVQITRPKSEGFDWLGVVKNKKNVQLSQRIKPEGREPYQCTSDPVILPCYVHEGDGPVDTNVVDRFDEASFVLLASSFGTVAPVLQRADSVSCALRGGQADLAELLQNNDSHEGVARPVLAFENTPDDDLEDICENRANGWKLYPVITDRICGSREANLRHGRVTVPCEPYLRMVAPDNDQVQAVFRDNLLTSTERGSDSQPIRLVDESYIRFHQKRKRWMVNSLHEVLALFSASTLLKSDLPLEDQFLPQTIEWSMNHDSTLHYAVQLFMRMQAMRLTLESESHEDAVLDFYGTTSQQYLYSTFISEARSTFKRMREFADLIGRLVDPSQLKKELRKYDEHVRRAMKSVRENEKRFRAMPILGRPDVDELLELKELLQESLDRLSA